ncbi:uncharacterized protein CEXT_328771 [Caerostris extrusa]|uniref:Secreted protein n=1 Tax=Caerostris extrusa TaxID=172846 RepID=A0AAV4Q1B5_CAEEX|nr:uncharacterized protein CEXT_328771 [Caerostris extrusa]
MKTFVIVCIILVLGSVQCARIRRQAVAPAADAAPGGMDLAVGAVQGELDKETALGGPVNPAGVQKAADLTSGIQSVGDDPDKTPQEKLTALTGDVVADAAKPDFSSFMAGAAKPADKSVNLSQFGP